MRVIQDISSACPTTKPSIVIVVWQSTFAITRTISEVPFDRDPRKRANVAEGSSFTILAHGAQHLIFADQEVTCMTESASERSRVKKAIAS